MSTMEELMKSVNKQAKSEIMSLGLNSYTYRRIPFTSPSMNYCSYGGIPVGKITEFYGAEHGGKTTTALDIIANYQNGIGAVEGRKALFVDSENSLDVEWAEKIGVDVSDMYVVKPESQSGEQLLQLILDAIKTNQIGLWVLDSIGALVPSSQLDEKKTLEDKTYCGISKPLTEFAGKVEMLMQRHQCTGLAINQLRDNITSTWGGTKTPGGRAWRHFCMVRMEFTRGSFIDENHKDLTRSAKTPSGNIVMMSMTKNKTCPPNRRIGQYTLNYNEGIDYLWDLVDVGIQMDIIQQSGAWFTIINPDTGEILSDEKIQGQNNVSLYLQEHTELLTQVEKMLDDKIALN